MLGDELVDQAVPLLSTAIGMIMEDHAGEALTTGRNADHRECAGRLTDAGRDIATLAQAMEVLLRRRESRPTP